LFVTAMAAFAFSTMAGGGGAMILLPVVNALLGTDKAAPIIQLGNFLGRPTRIILFWKNINWNIVKAYLPLAAFGAFLGAWLFSNFKSDVLQLIIALFLVSTAWQFKFGKEKKSFPMKLFWFGPIGFVVAFISSLVGATGPLLNPFYLNYGVSKEELVATKAANSFFVAMIQLPTYAFFGALEGSMWSYGLAIGLGAGLGNFIGKKWLKKITDLRFRQLLVITMVVIGGVWLLKLLFKYLGL
ncbi:MAG: sulfite exporter TauE/SafE family protein, partial [Flavobacteriales bacterium]